MTSRPLLRLQCSIPMQVALVCISLANILMGQTSPTGDRLKALAPPDLSIGGVMGGYGANLSSPILSVAESEFNAVTTQAFMAYGPWQNRSDPIDTSGLSSNVAWAFARGLRVHAHVLVYPTENVHLDWYQQLPNDEVESVLSQYVSTMAASTAGGVWVWDVVNEVIGDTGDVMDSDGLRMGLGTGDDFVAYKEYAAMGPDYIRKAFEWARAADPNAILIINEYSAEHLGDKSDRLFEFCKKLRDAGVPLDGVGFQNHWLDLRYEPNYASIRANFQRFADEGFQIFMTEVDVASTHTQNPLAAPPTDQELQRQKRIFEELMQIALDQPACKSFLMWDFTDETSWLQNTNFTLTLHDRRPGHQDTIIPPGTSMFATPFHGGNGSPIEAKPAYYGIQEALESHTSDVYRMASGWDRATSYLARYGQQDVTGSYNPTAGVYLDTLDAASESWASMKWRLDRVDTGVYRLSNLWENGEDVLTRVGTPDGAQPSATVALHARNNSWSSQHWFLFPSEGGGYRLVNGWSPLDGVLTREANGQDNSGQYIPGPDVRLYPIQNWLSQVWHFDRIPQ